MTPSALTINEAAFALTGSSQDYDDLLDLIGDACFVLLGEASHGTHEFYRGRARITQRLIKERGFQAVTFGAQATGRTRAMRWAALAGSPLSNAARQRTTARERVYATRIV